MPEEPSLSIWLRPERSGRGPVPAFDRERLAAAGVALADADGLAAVTMRAVAQSLGAGPASLYRYVTTRDELLELMIDQVVGEISYAGLGSGRPLDDLLALARQSRLIHLRHPWLPDATTWRSPLGPNAVAYLEHSLAALAELPVTSRTKWEAISVMNAVVVSLTRAELAQQATGGTLQRWQQAQREYLSRVAASGQPPHVAAALSGAAKAEQPPEVLFDRLITRVLTGLLRTEDTDDPAGT